MTAVRHSVVLFILIIGLSFSSLQQAYARNSGGLKLTRAFSRAVEADQSTDGAGMDVEGGMSATTTYERTGNGPVAIAETDPDGRFIVLENDASRGSRQDVNLTNWSLQRQLDEKRTILYTFPPVVIKHGQTLKIWGRGYSSQAGTGDWVFRGEDSWGKGALVVTTLLNDKNEKQASLIQKPLYF